MTHVRKNVVKCRIHVTRHATFTDFAQLVSPKLYSLYRYVGTVTVLYLKFDKANMGSMLSKIRIKVPP